MEFSKKLVTVSWVFAAAFCTIVIIGSFCGIDVSGITEIALRALEVVGLVSAFYSWKAKNENRIKLMKKMVNDWADKYGIESVAALADIVLKE